MANKILKYTSRDYESIKADLIDAISAISGTWTSREDGDPGIVLIKAMSALGDMLSYNFDKQANEYYAPTVTQRKNAAKLFELIGYKMRWYQSAMTTVTLTNMFPIPNYMYYCKRIVDGETPQTVYIEYRNEYTTLNPSASPTEEQYMIQCPPTINGQEIPLPASMIAAHQGRFEIDNLPQSTIDEQDLIDHADLFANYAKMIYSYWQTDNAIPLHTNLADPAMSLNIYGQDSSNLIYSLVPTTINVVPSLGKMETVPTYYLLPYEPMKLPAIQGYVNKITFTKAQLKNNRFYLPDSSLDDTYMYLSYTTTDSNSTREKTIFIDKTDNLLTVTDFDNTNVIGADENYPKLYFQFDIDDFDYPYIELSSYWEDQLGADGVKFTFYYFRTLGKNGSVTTNFLTNMGAGILGTINVSNVASNTYVLDSNGNYLSSPGANPQTAEDAYIDSLNYIMTYNTLVTIYDFTRFTKRQDGISNAFACDGQYAKDLNNNTLEKLNAYSVTQLQSMLGDNASSITDKSQLVNLLMNIKKINYDYTQNCYTKEQAMNPPNADSFVSYGINLYPIWGNFEGVGVDPLDTETLAKYTNIIQTPTGTITSPYYVYKINTESDGYSDPERYSIETMLNTEIDKTRIISIIPRYTACRVFPWRCCGTVHLTQVVSQEDANNIIKNIVNYLANLYTPQNMEFGKKLTYMEVIDAILNSDPRIRYFDAGIGNKKLIEYQQPENSSNYFNVEAYFNPESIMRYVQTVDEIMDENSEYYNMICVDPNYIQQVT